MIYKSNVHGKLKVKGKILSFGQEVELSDSDLSNDKETRELVVTQQLIRKID